MTREEILQKAKDWVAEQKGYKNWELLMADASEVANVSLVIRSCYEQIALRCMELVQQEGETQSWVNVNEKLPTPEILVLCRTKHGHFHTGFYSKEPLSTFAPWPTFQFDPVTHWQPLPEFKPENK